MTYRIIVLAKQVPDTRNVGKDAMKADGTVNRAALSAIFNPEDLCALEQALRIKDQFAESTITLLTMGPGRAADVLREGLYRGADKGILLTDRAFAGADTLATSYALAQAIKKIGEFDLIIGGRQAIDGDTAQVGPQVAEKLGIPQLTYTESIETIGEHSITVRRQIDGGVEIAKVEFPALLTVTAAQQCRPRNAQFFMKYKRALTPGESAQQEKEPYTPESPLHLTEWSVSDVDADIVQCGLSGSPTKVKKVENIIFQAKDNRRIEDNDQEIEDLIVELLNNHTIG